MFHDSVLSRVAFADSFYDSSQMIFQHYRACLAVARRRQELVTEKGAEAWFAITPESTKALRVQAEKERQALWLPIDHGSVYRFSAGLLPRL